MVRCDLLSRSLGASLTVSERIGGPVANSFVRQLFRLSVSSLIEIARAPIGISSSVKPEPYAENSSAASVCVARRPSMLSVVSQAS